MVEEESSRDGTRYYHDPGVNELWSIGFFLSMILVLASAAEVIDKHCQVHDGTVMICRCVTNEEFILPEYNYENITSLEISSCYSANLHFNSLELGYQVNEIVVRNISDRLLFDLSIMSTKMRRCELSQIRRIPVISSSTFTNQQTIEVFIIENTFIEKFEETFTDITVTNFVMSNVTIGHIEGINFSERGSRLQLTNTDFQNVTGSLNFDHFSRVHIQDSRFALQKPGKLLLDGESVFVSNSVFLNASMNFGASSDILINSTCADGKSSLRLFSDKIESLNNRLPTEIIYTKYRRRGVAESVVNHNNTVCIAGNCKCPKRSGQSSSYPTIVTFGILLIASILL